MWVWFAVLSAGFVIADFFMILLEARRSRAGTRRYRVVSGQLSALMRKAEVLQAGISAISRQRLVELLPEECDAALKRVSNGLCYYKHLEDCVSDEDRERLKRMSSDPFTDGTAPAEKLLPSQTLGESLAALRAIKAKFHGTNPETFSREVGWVYGGTGAGGGSFLNKERGQP